MHKFPINTLILDKWKSFQLYTLINNEWKSGKTSYHFSQKTLLTSKINDIRFVQEHLDDIRFH